MDERCSCHPQADENVKLPIPTSNLIYLHSSQILFFSSVFCFFVNYFHHLTVITSEPSFNICTSYQRLMPHWLRIMQTIAYSTKTCPPSTHIVWKAPPRVIVWFIMNAERGFTRWLTVWAWRTFFRRQCFCTHTKKNCTHVLMTQLAKKRFLTSVPACMKVTFRSSSVYTGSRSRLALSIKFQEKHTFSQFMIVFEVSSLFLFRKVSTKQVQTST